jgi:nucleoside-diphosphate-sugar epimerase
LSKYLILGGRSYLAQEFVNLLTKNKIESISIDSLNSKNYSTSKLKNFLDKVYAPVIVDFKFPIVSSNNSDFDSLTIDDVLKPQLNLIQLLNEYGYSIQSLFLISTSKVYDTADRYSELKFEQENLYKDKLNKKIELQIIRLNSVIGPRDKNNKRLVPFFYKSILIDGYVNLNIHSDDKKQFIYVEDAVSNIYLISQSIKPDNYLIHLTYSELISTLSYILVSEFNHEHQVCINGLEIKCKNMVRDKTLYNRLVKTTNWYVSNISLV